MVHSAPVAVNSQTAARELASMHLRRLSAAGLAVALLVCLAAVFGWSVRRAPVAPANDAAPPAAPAGDARERVSTFSIVGFDPATGDLGVAVASRFFGVGTVVPYAAAGVGAIATQSLANTSYGPRGLELLRAGNDAQGVLDRLLADDPQRDDRQVGIVDASGNAVTFTGAGCLTWAGGRTGTNYSAQGNILAGPGVVDAMARAFEGTEGDLATRLTAALAAGQAAGGDARGRQSAALLVVREGGGYGGYDDHYIDLRVDDHPTPIVELQRLLDIRHAGLRVDEGTRALQEAARAGADQRDELLQRALAAYTEATALDPANGWNWMTLAAARLEIGDADGAAAAGVRALQADPWVKTGILRGFGSLEVAEQLLDNDAFRRAWEAIQVSYRSP